MHPCTIDAISSTWCRYLWPHFLLTTLSHNKSYPYLCIFLSISITIYCWFVRCLPIVRYVRSDSSQQLLCCCFVLYLSTPFYSTVFLTIVLILLNYFLFYLIFLYCISFNLILSYLILFSLSSCQMIIFYYIQFFLILSNPIQSSSVKYFFITRLSIIFAHFKHFRSLKFQVNVTLRL